jgi:SAM-dependent methyltransferase
MDEPCFDKRETVVTCDGQRRAIDGHLRFLEWLGKPLQPGARVLDFGCGIGQAVEILLDMGYDVHGVDIVDWWRRDDYWDKSYVPQARVTERLQRMDEANYRIPFPDGHFEFCFSDQVMEHVRDHASVFGEIARVLKPDAISVHRFPRALLFQGLSRNVGHFGPTFARSTGSDLASGFGVERRIHGQS